MKKRKKRKLKIKNVAIALVLLGSMIAAVFAVIYLPNRLVDVMYIEAGTKSTLSETLFIKTDEEGAFKTKLRKIDLQTPGNYEVKIQVGFMTYTSMLVVTDTSKPSILLKEIVAPVNSTLTPQDFVEEAHDNTEVTYSFIVAPDTTQPGIQAVEIEATDLGGNATVAHSTVLVSQIRDTVIMEAGSTPPVIEDFLLEEKKDEEFVTNLSSLKLVVGKYPIKIKMGDRTLVSFLEVVDTIAPTAKVRSISAYVGDKLSASAFVSTIVDASKVTVSFKSDTNLTAKAGTYAPVIVLRDAGGNVSELTANLVVTRDTQAPVISGSGLKDRTVYVGASFNVKSNVYATDNRDGKVNVTVSGSVNFTKTGVYPITFSAKDKAGNTSSVKITVTVITHPPFSAKGDTGNSELNQLVDTIFAKTLHGDMSNYEVVRALYDFGRTIRYQAGPLASPWQTRALSTLTTRTGNCFGRMYAMEALFVRAGIPQREQIQYNQVHSWNQVDIGNGWQNVDIGYSVLLQSDAYLRNRALISSSIQDDLWETTEPVKIGKVYVDHVDETLGLKIADTVVLSGNVGTSYASVAVTVAGYTYQSRTSNYNGLFSESNITVTYTYRQSTE